MVINKVIKNMHSQLYVPKFLKLLGKTYRKFDIFYLYKC